MHKIHRGAGCIRLTWQVVSVLQVEFLPEAFPGAKAHHGFLEVRQTQLTCLNAWVLRPHVLGDIVHTADTIISNC